MGPSLCSAFTLAAKDNVKEFLKLASTKLEAENLVTLWRHAHSEGYKKGRKSVLGIGTGTENPGVSHGFSLGLGYGFEFCTPM